MQIPEMAAHRVGTNFPLEEPAPLPELDSWVEEYIRSRRRFTFTEGEVLKPLWDAGEDIRLREDSRFREVNPSQPAAESQWRLATHTVANQALYELLMDELWDGRDLCRCLESLDQAANDSSFHIFCLGDERFLLSQDEGGLYRLSLKEVPVVELTSEQKRVIDMFASQLLTHFPDDRTKPWTTSFIAEELRRLVYPADALDMLVPVALENWLLHQEEWTRVGIDSWLPKKRLPAIAKKHRYAVPPMVSTTGDNIVALPGLKGDAEPSTSREAEQGVEVQKQGSLNERVRWRITLRTCHINEGTIPVPKQARTLYPLARKMASVAAVPGLWFADGIDMTVWLDRTRHRFFGEDLQDQFAFLEAGQVLEVEWTPAGLVFHTLHVDAAVAEEEARLIDLTHLAQLRSTILESYRASLRALMNDQHTALSFQTLYEELCKRQQHKPNRATIRAIVSSSPDFVLLKAEGKWMLNPAITSEVGAKVLRRSVMLAKQVEGDSRMIPRETIFLSEIIATNRRHIKALRSLYFPEKTSSEHRGS